MRRGLICALAVVLLLSGCSLRPQPSPTPPVAAPVVAGRTEVGGAGVSVSGVSVSDAPLGTKEMDDLSGWGDFPMAAGRPSEIRIDGAIPPEGLRITRRYQRPLPEGAIATLAYFSTDLDSWVAVPSAIAQDRRSVSAVVHHLSWWNDFVSGTQDAVKAIGDAAAGVADWAYYNVGKVFDTRVDPPVCSIKTPEWVDSTTFIETHRNNSILFCVGRDEDKPEILVIKARVNRGFGFNAEASAKATWTHNSSFDPNDLEEAWTTLAELDKVLADSMRNITSDGRMTAPGQEYSFGLSEEEARKLKSYLALNLNPQPVLPFLVTTLGQLVGSDMTSKADGYVAAVMATAKCSKDVASVTDGATWSKAALSCVSGIDETLAKQLASYLLRRGVKDAGKLAGRIVGKMSLYLACIGPVFNGMNYWAEQGLVEDARTVHVFPAIVKDPPVPTVADLIKAGVCGAGGRITGHTSFTHPTWGKSMFVTCLDLVNRELQGLAVTDARGTIRWSYQITGNYYELGTPTPGSDASGNLFVIYNPGRYDGVAIFQPVDDSMKRLAGFYSYDDAAGEDERFYFSELVGPDNSGLFSIRQSSNDCSPSCAGGTTLSRLYFWNGVDYAPK